MFASVSDLPMASLLEGVDIIIMNGIKSYIGFFSFISIILSITNNQSNKNNCERNILATYIWVKQLPSNDAGRQSDIWIYPPFLLILKVNTIYLQIWVLIVMNIDFLLTSTIMINVHWFIFLNVFIKSSLEYYTKYFSW